LGSGPRKELFAQVAVPVADELTAGAFLGPWRLMAVDGFRHLPRAPTDLAVSAPFQGKVPASDPPATVCTGGKGEAARASPAITDEEQHDQSRIPVILLMPAAGLPTSHFPIQRERTRRNVHKTRRIKLAALLGGLLVAASMVGSGSAHAVTAGSVVNVRKYENGIGKCLDEDTTRRGHVQLWHCSGGSEQRWTVTYESSLTPGGLPYMVTIENQRTGDCLAASPSNVPGQPVQAVPGPCEFGNAAERWIQITANNVGQGWYQVWRNDFTGNCLELRANNSSDGAVVQEGACDISNIAQMWSPWNP
jgi:hypothetical protein